MERGINTPFKLPLWSEWTIQLKENITPCENCQSTTTALKALAIQSLIKQLKQVGKHHEIAAVLIESCLPPILYTDVARQLFALKQWSALRSLVSYWPYETFLLSQIIHINCPHCWQLFLDSEDVEDAEKEGGDTERQVFRKVFKHILDGYFFAVKSTLENEDYKGPLRTLDLTLNPSQDIRGFLWEDEFRRLGRRVIKTLDVCVLAGLHKKGRQNHSKRVQDFVTGDDECHWQPSEGYNTHFVAQEKSPSPKFEISTWGEEPSVQSTSENAEIGVWNGNAIDLSHLSEMPLFSVTVDASISEKSWDILSWIRQRYEDFLPSPSPLSIQIRFLEVSLHEERKFDAFVSRLPYNIHGLQLAEIFEQRSAEILAAHLSRFQAVRFLDLGSCAFNLGDQSRLVCSIADALARLPRLERLSLAHNSITGCLSQLLGQFQHGLQLLDISSCCLNEEDLLFLGESIHCDSLCALNLASNELGLRWWPLTLSLTERFGPSLRILDLSSNEFVESQLLALCRTAAVGPLSSLSLLDLSWHELTLTTLNDLIELVASQSLLHTLCLSTPVDMAEAGYDQPESWQLFVDDTSRLAEKHRRGRQPLLLHWCLM